MKTPGNRTVLPEVTFLSKQPGSNQSGDAKDLWNLNFFGVLLNRAEQEFMPALRARLCYLKWNFILMSLK